MKRLNLVLLFFIFGILAMVSCSDSNSPSDTKNYFPSSEGDYWIYDSKMTVDSNEVDYTDSTVCKGTETHKGKTAFKFETYLNGSLSDTYYRYSEDSKLYALPTELIPIAIKNIFPTNTIPDDWVVIADAKASNWNMVQFNVDSIQLPTQYGNVQVGGVITVSGQKSGTKNFTINNESVPTEEFTTKTAFSGTVKLMGASLPVNFQVLSKSYYADKVGLVQTNTEKQNVDLNSPFGNFTLFTVDASSRTLIRYNVK